MITKEASHRPSTADISNDVYFATGNLAVLRAVDSLPLRDVGTQGAQLSNLRSQLSDFPPRLLIGAVLPAVCR